MSGPFERLGAKVDAALRLTDPVPERDDFADLPEGLTIHQALRHLDWRGSAQSLEHHLRNAGFERKIGRQLFAIARQSLWFRKTTS